MATGRELMREWVLEALRARGGSSTLLEVCKSVWHTHKSEIEAGGKLLYEWQYEIRWAGTLLRKEGLMRQAEQSPRGIWEINE